MKYSIKMPTGAAIRSKLKNASSALLARAHWVALGLLVTVGLLSFWNTSALIKSSDSRIQLRMLIVDLQDLFVTVNEAEAGQRGYLLVGEDSYLVPYRKAAQEVDQKIARVQNLIGAVPAQRPAFDALRRLIAMKMAELKTTVQLRQRNGIDAAMVVVRSGQGDKQMAGIRVLMERIRDDVQQSLARQDVRTLALSVSATRWGILGIVLAAALFVTVIRRERWELASVAQVAQDVVDSAESSRLQILRQTEGRIQVFGQQARELARSVESLRIQTMAQSNGDIEAVGRQPRSVAAEIDALEQQARELARSVESSRLQTLKLSDEKIEALGQQARELASLVEASRMQALKHSDKKIEMLDRQAREFARNVESFRIQTIRKSDQEIADLGQQARELATSVETSRVKTLNQSELEIDALGQQARDLATSVESSRVETLDRSDKELEALERQARDLATSVETLRIQTLNKSDKQIESLGQQSRELATSVETSRVLTLKQSDREIRKLNDELDHRVSQHMAELEAANKELESFSYSVSHDLRAPLRAIDGFSRIVLEDYSAPLAAEGKAYLQMVRDNTRQMGRLVDDLLAFSHLGRQALAKHTVDPDKMVRWCLEEMTKEQEGRRVEIVIGDLPTCQADPTLLKQVWTNLISNALKYTRKQEIAHIEISSRVQPRAISDEQTPGVGGAESERVYFIKDNGAGFDMKYAHKLFGVFQRLHRATDYEGTGVGLAIVQRIIQRHGGRIWADASPNESATFSFTLE